MSGENRSKKRTIRIGATAVIVAIAAGAEIYLMGLATDPGTTSSVSTPAHGEPENVAAPANPALRSNSQGDRPSLSNHSRYSVLGARGHG